MTQLQSPSFPTVHVPPYRPAGGTPTPSRQPGMAGDSLQLGQLALATDPGTLAARERLGVRVRDATSRATRRFHNVRRACFDTAWHGASLLGGKGWDDAVRSTSARGQQLDHLAVSERVGNLKPGMIIYANRRPGHDPNSVDLSNKPHWFTYVGKDQAGVLRFSDQYGDDFSLAEIVARYGATRKIDAIFDPIAHQRV